MNKRYRNLTLKTLGLAVILLLTGVGLLRLPGLWVQTRQFNAVRQQLQEPLRLRKKLDDFRVSYASQTAAIRAELEQQQRSAAASFTCPAVAEIPMLVENLENTIVNSGVTLEHLGYKAREQRDGLVILPFEAVFSATYPDLRRLLHAIETHPAGIRIEQLEFRRFDAVAGFVQAHLSGSVRFL